MHVGRQKVCDFVSYTADANYELGMERDRVRERERKREGNWRKFLYKNCKLREGRPNNGESMAVVSYLSERAKL